MALNKVTTIDGWNPQDACIERLMDNAAYTSAHPDDTLVLVGPARVSNVAGEGSDFSNLQAVGMLQQMQVSQQRAVQPLQAIGSGRNYFLAGKPMVNFSIGRLFAKGPNLYRALYNNIMSNDTIKGFNPKEPASASNNPDSVFNMDSEMFLVPFGLVVAFRDKSGGSLGSFYIESCMISSYSIGVAAGQNMVMENVNGSADRIYPINLTTNAATANFFNDATATSANTVATTDTDFSTTRST
jgi:hypothetical protein